MRVSQRTKNALIVLAAAAIGFLAGGGCHLRNTTIDEILHPHRAQGDDFVDDIEVYIITFIYDGGAGALAGAGLVALTLFLLGKRRKLASPNQGP